MGGAVRMRARVLAVSRVVLTGVRDTFNIANKSRAGANINTRHGYRKYTKTRSSHADLRTVVPKAVGPQGIRQALEQM